MKMSTMVIVKQGTVRGVKSVLPNGRTYYYFKGIPYALPPVGELRFQAPVPMEIFPSPVIDCMRDGDACIQKDELTGDIFGSENCLFLNIYAPESESVYGKSLPVMIYIHEGGYYFGSSNSDKYTPLYLMQEGVIIVTFNYRIGALGFLSLPEANIPGNAGLKDQRLVLQWVQDNISQFNGNPNTVTVFGTSSGSACAHLHTMSENSKNLFHRAILQSGTANSSWVLQTNASNRAIKFAQCMGCTSDDPFEVLNFLKSYTNLEDFVTYPPETLTNDDLRCSFPIAFKPVIEKQSPDSVVTEDPLKLMSKLNSIGVPLLMGTTSAEGMIPLRLAATQLEEFNQDLGRFIPWDLNLHPEDPKHIQIAQHIRNFYFNGKTIDENMLNNASELFGDFYFIIDIYRAAEIHSRIQIDSPLFFYRFNYIGGLDFYRKLVDMGYVKGACHADDIHYIFQSALTENLAENRDKKITETLCKLWTNFAKYGNPTPNNCEPFVDCTWEPVPKIGEGEDFTLNLFVIDEKQKMIESPDQKRMEFWKSIIQEYKGNWLSKL